MCGIAFCYNQSLSEHAAKINLNEALDLLRHRGPDDSGYWIKRPVSIGHRRLAVLDLASSHQPMIDPSGRYILTFNGEIYNYQDLKEHLKDKWDFHTQGDTEVILAGLILYGESFITRLEGMWAFAFWDRQEQSLLLSRDRMGKKPLYYESDGKTFICASELPALASLSDKQWHEDYNSTADYFRYGFYLPGTTAYKNIYEVLPGHNLSWKAGKPPTSSSYWALNVGSYAGTRNTASDTLQHKLTKAVKRRMVADVEVGAFLSGGIDSSLIVGLMTKALGIKPKTFTIGFNDPAFDERQYAQKVSDYCHTQHYSECLESWDKQELLRLLIKNVGQPFTDSSILPTALVSRLASKKVKVALSGDGGDELFCGYQRYHARSVLRWYTRLPVFFRRNIERFIKLIPEPMSHHSRSLIKKAHLFCDIVDRQDAETPYIAPVFYSSDVFQKLLPDIYTLGHKPPMIPSESNIDSLGHMMTSDALIYLPQDILAKVDRASMAYSLETRAPFLDREVVEFAFSLPTAWHYKKLKGKRMLYESLKEFIPDVIWNRKKQGFGVPIHSWFRGDLGNDLVELIHTTPNIPFEKEMLLNMLEVHKNGIRDHGFRLWNIYVYLQWRCNTPWLIS